MTWPSVDLSFESKILKSTLTKWHNGGVEISEYNPIHNINIGKIVIMNFYFSYFFSFTKLKLQHNWYIARNRICLFFRNSGVHLGLTRVSYYSLLYLLFQFFCFAQIVLFGFLRKFIQGFLWLWGGVRVFFYL